MATMTGKLTGDRDAIAVFNNLAAKAQKKIARPAINAAGTPVVKALRQAAPRGRNGFFRRSMAKVVRVYSSGALVVVCGQDTKKSFKTAKRIRGGGISGSGHAVPIHLVDQPTRTHEIKPRHAGALAIGDGKTIHIRRRARHPGTTGARFVIKAARNAERSAADAFDAKLAAGVIKHATKSK